MLNKKGQITIFVILAIAIVVGGISYFVFRDVVETESTLTSVEPVKLAVLDCIEERVELGISILESSGGYIELPRFEAGSRYQPFSSELTFAGVDIPYWFYMSGSNLPRTQVPTIESMESQLEEFLNEEIETCYLDSFLDDGYSIEMETPRSSIKIEENYVDVILDMDVIIERNSDVGILYEHEVRVDTKLGYLYNEAKSIYDEEQSTFFLENYTIDVLRLYAPVDGVELTCSPMTWESEDIYNDVKESLEANTLQLRNTNSKEDYFNLELESDANVNFLYFRDWTTYFEVNPTSDNVLVAKPIGNDKEMGLMGFCYVPYHFVYNFRHPVLIQVTEDDETFQFPMTVLIEGNLPRESVGEQIETIPEDVICENKNSNVELNIYDEDLNPVEASVSFECVGVSCDINYVEGQDIPTSLPQCANGVLRVDADGYKKYKTIYSSVNDGSIAVVLEKEYDKEISLVVADKEYSDNAIITFSSDEFSKTIIYPENKDVSLPSGDYDIQIYLHKSSELKLPATTAEECYTVPKAGLLGLAGLTRKECNTYEVPEQLVTDALVGGGNSEYYFSRSELKNSEIVELSLDRLIVPSTFDELQANYLLLDVSSVGVELI